MLLLMSCFGEVVRFQESGRISQIDDVVDLAGWSRVGGEFWKGKCALSNPLNQVITETQSKTANCAQTTICTRFKLISHHYIIGMNSSAAYLF